MLIEEVYRRVGLSPSSAQSALVKSALGERLNGNELSDYLEYTGRVSYRAGAPVQELLALAGRKGGKSEYCLAPLLIYLAVQPTDSPGVYLIVAPSRSDQAALDWRAVSNQIQRGFPELVSEIKESEGRIILGNDNEIRIASANFRTLRGPKYHAVAIDEVCWFFADSADEGGANPLELILDSVQGGMVATKHPLLALFSTPYRKTGIAYDWFQNRDANPDRLVWRASTLAMNPHANRDLMERHRKQKGAAFYAQEYEALFSDDVYSYIEPADVDAAIRVGTPFFPYRPGVRYFMGLDPGRKRDHFGAAIAHKEMDTVTVDWCAEWKPGLLLGLKYADVLPEIWKKARDYHIKKIFSDQVDFGGLEASIPNVGAPGTTPHPEFLMERTMTGGTSGAELSDTTRALFATHKLVLPDVDGLADEFKRLADFLGQGGSRDVRARRGHDDRSRAAMLAIFQAFSQKAGVVPWIASIPRREEAELDNPRWWHPL